MGVCEFLNQIDNELRKEGLTDNNFFTVYFDKDYVPKLEKLYTLISGYAKQNDMIYISELTKSIIEIISQYLNGKIWEASKRIDEILNPLLNDPLIYSSFNESGCFTGYSVSHDVTEIALYRGRTSKIELENGEEDMYHIPFSKRELVGNERFSILGVPCLYLARSIYTCWNELGKPQDSEFYVSKVTVNNSIQNFNLAINLKKVKEIAKESQYSSSVKNIIKLWILKLACSCVVKQENRKFKSEYIVPQLIMCELVNLKPYDIHSITYFTNRAFKTEFRDYFAPISVNVAIIAQQEGESEYSKHIGKEIQFTRPVNFSEFKQICNLRPTNKVTSPNVKREREGNIKYVELAGRVMEYQYTEFAQFEGYIEALAKEAKER